MSSRKPARPAARPPAKKAAAPARKSGKAGGSRMPLLAVLAVIFLSGGGLFYWSLPRGPHAWRPLGAGGGTLRWAETVRGGTIAPPVAPDWIRQLRRAHIPWPTDLPLTPAPAAFGSAEGGAAAWFVIRSPEPAKELWHVEKASVRLTDAAGHRVPWEGGSGAVRVGEAPHTQMFYLRLPPELAGAPGNTLRFRLARGSARTGELTFPMP